MTGSETSGRESGGPGGAQTDPRVYFAAERTFLAWIRTGIGLMAIGFAVSRFGLFLREMRLPEGVRSHTTGMSLYSGVALVALGVMVLLASVAQHLGTVRRLREGSWTPGVARGAVVLGLLLAAAGVGMAVMLVVVR